MNISYINIPGSVPNKCSLQCNLWYDYKTSPTSLVSSTESSLKINYDGSGSNVMYNSSLFRISSSYAITLFVGGIHKFNDVQPPLEMVIKHESQDTNTELYICIPITSSGNITSMNPIETILTSYFPQKTTTRVNTSNFNLNYVIPKSTYFVHTGTYHGTSRPRSVYIVFPRDKLMISSQAITLMTGRTDMTPYTSVIKKTDDLIQNERGTTVNGFSGEDQIYIDCQPTDSQGEIVIKENIVPTDYYKFNMSGLVYFIVAVISCILMITLYQKIKAFFTINNM